MSEEAAVLREAVSMNILIVDDEPSIRETCAEVARQAGMKAFAVASAEEALEVLENSAVDIVLTDLILQRTSGLDLLKRVHDTNPTLPVIVLTQYGTIDSAVAATRLGAVDYVTKPFRIEELRSRLERAARAVELQQENHLLREQLRTRPGFGGLIGLSERMQRVTRSSKGSACTSIRFSSWGRAARARSWWPERAFFRTAQRPAFCSRRLLLARPHAD